MFCFFVFGLKAHFYELVQENINPYAVPPYEVAPPENYQFQLFSPPYNYKFRSIST